MPSLNSVRTARKPDPPAPPEDPKALIAGPASVVETTPLPTIDTPGVEPPSPTVPTPSTTTPLEPSAGLEILLGVLNRSPFMDRCNIVVDMADWRLIKKTGEHYGVDASFLTRLGHALVLHLLGTEEIGVSWRAETTDDAIKLVQEALHIAAQKRYTHQAREDVHAQIISWKHR